MYFADSTRLIRVKLAGAVTTNQLPIVGSYVEITVATFAAADAVPIHTVTNSTTVVTLVGSPSAGTLRVLQTLAINNADTAAATVTVEAYDSTNARTIVKATLAVGDTLIYETKQGWKVLDSNGQVKNVFSDTSIYALLSGRGGGQILYGDTGASGNLTLRSTSNATKGKVLLADDGGNVQVGGAAAASEMQFYEPSVGGTSYVGFKSPALAATIGFTLPAADGAGPLVSDGSLVLSFSAWATQAQMEAATATNVAVVPARVQNHPGVGKAWANFNGTGTPALNSSHNTDSVSDVSTGIQTLTWTTDFSSVDYACAGMVKRTDNGANTGLGGVMIRCATGAQAVGSLTTLSGTNAGVEDEFSVQVICLGDQ